MLIIILLLISTTSAVSTTNSSRSSASSYIRGKKIKTINPSSSTRHATMLMTNRSSGATRKSNTNTSRNDNSNNYNNNNANHQTENNEKKTIVEFETLTKVLGSQPNNRKQK